MLRGMVVVCAAAGFAFPRFLRFIIHAGGKTNTWHLFRAGLSIFNRVAMPSTQATPCAVANGALESALAVKHCDTKRNNIFSVVIEA
jgi:hypothetical protein